MQFCSNQTVVLSMIIMKLRLSVEQNNVSLVATADTCLRSRFVGIKKSYETLCSKHW